MRKYFASCEDQWTLEEKLCHWNRDYIHCKFLGLTDSVQDLPRTRSSGSMLAHIRDTLPKYLEEDLRVQHLRLMFVQQYRSRIAREESQRDQALLLHKVRRRLFTEN